MLTGNTVAQDSFLFECEINYPKRSHTISMASLRNKRETNEDSLILWTSEEGVIFAAVADGLGGHPDGEAASHYTVNKLQELLSKDPVTEDNFFLKVTSALTSIGKDLHEQSNIPQKRKLSDYRLCRDTTVVVAAIFPTKILVVNIGDSGAKCLSNGSLKGTVRQGEGRFVSHTVAELIPSLIHYYTWDLNDKEFFLYLHTDGCDYVGSDFIGLLTQHLRKPARDIVQEALESSTDNATAITIHGVVV